MSGTKDLTFVVVSRMKEQVSYWKTTSTGTNPLHNLLSSSQTIGRGLSIEILKFKYLSLA